MFLIFFTFSFFIFSKKSLAASCLVSSAVWSVAGQTNVKTLPSGWYSDDKPPAVTIDVLIKNCAGKIAEISIVEDDTVGIDDDISELDDMEISIPDNNYTFSITLTAGETECENFAGDNNDCEYFIKVDLAGAGNNFSSDGRTNGNLKYECDGNTVFDPYPCDKDWSFGSTTGPKAPAGECAVVSAGFDPGGKQTSGWFKESKKPEVLLTIKTKKCEGQAIGVSITEKGIYWDTDISDLNDKRIIIDGKYTDSKTGINTIQLKMKAGETNCISIIPGYDPDCQYYIAVDPPGWWNEVSSQATSRLSYDCDGACQDSVAWSFLGVSGSIEGAVLPGGTSGPEPSLQETGQYDLLAPLPFFGSTFDIKGGLTPYLQVLFQLLIGIAGLLSVIMIVIGGIEYMSTDAIQGKEEGKERITQAILGLILALGAWLLLNTINPDLLSLRINMSKQTIEADSNNTYDGVPQTPTETGGTGGKYCKKSTGGVGYAANSTWPPANMANKDITQRSGNQLKAGDKITKITINKPNCKSVSQSNCTSIDGFNRNGIIKLYNSMCGSDGSKCTVDDLVITGGTECWQHGDYFGGHHPGSQTTDLRVTPALNKYLSDVTKTTDFPGGCKVFVKNGMNFKAEDESCPWKPSKHWHVTY